MIGRDADATSYLDWKRGLAGHGWSCCMALASSSTMDGLALAHQYPIGRVALPPRQCPIGSRLREKTPARQGMPMPRDFLLGQYICCDRLFYRKRDHLNLRPG